MDTHILKEVLACLRGERTLFTYHQDAYATWLLQRVLKRENAVPLKSLRQSSWANLLQRPLVREVLANCGNGYLQHHQLTDLWVRETESFVLTVDAWGDEEGYHWDQISRPGGNLVLQLNLCNFWNQQFRNLVGESANEFFGYSHPISESRDMTLAWARMDIDFHTNEVLIEEIQSDLIRLVRRMRFKARRAAEEKKEAFLMYGKRIPAYAFEQFANCFLQSFNGIWEEAMLTATLRFIFEEIGIPQVYYHSAETGAVLKNIEGRLPPRSLYTKLPEKFCFSKTERAPNFLLKNRYARKKLKKLQDSCWFHMAA